MLVQTVIWLGITGAILFISAGTVRWPQAWIYLAEIGGLGLMSGFAIGKRDPGLLRERMAAPIQKDQKSCVITVFFALWMSQYVINGLDAVRFEWSHVPVWLQTAGGLAVALGLYAFHVVLETNTFAAPVVKIQSERKHQVISTGPYAYVRHPMYAGAVPLIVGTPLLLGSWYGLIWAAAMIVLLGFRAVLEENTLKAEFDGYDAAGVRLLGADSDGRACDHELRRLCERGHEAGANEGERCRPHHHPLHRSVDWVSCAGREPPLTQRCAREPAKALETAKSERAVGGKGTMPSKLPESAGIFPEGATGRAASRPSPSPRCRRPAAA
jgi:protein-S-isoprenylcysteine O-methyltransferase Ste14